MPHRSITFTLGRYRPGIDPGPPPTVQFGPLSATIHPCGLGAVIEKAVDARMQAREAAHREVVAAAKAELQDLIARAVTARLASPANEP